MTALLWRQCIISSHSKPAWNSLRPDYFLGEMGGLYRLQGYCPAPMYKDNAAVSVAQDRTQQTYSYECLSTRTRRMNQIVPLPSQHSGSRLFNKLLL